MNSKKVTSLNSASAGLNVTRIRLSWDLSKGSISRSLGQENIFHPREPIAAYFSLLGNEGGMLPLKARSINELSMLRRASRLGPAVRKPKQFNRRH
jgi:hypothetical protein